MIGYRVRVSDRIDYGMAISSVCWAEFAVDCLTRRMALDREDTREHSRQRQEN